MAQARLTKEQRIKRRKRFRRKLTGLIFLLFAVLGVVSIISTVVNRVNIMLDDTGERREYEILFSALVSLDPAEFTSIEKADPRKLKEAAILTTVELENPAKYERNEWGYTYLPTTDIDRYATKLFGPKINLENATFGQQGIIVAGGDGIDHTGYVYIPEREAYLVPPSSRAGSYFPRVESITRSRNTKTLLIAYLQTDSSLTAYIDPEAANVSAIKYREYVLLKDGSEYYLYSIRVPQNTD